MYIFIYVYIIYIQSRVHVGTPRPGSSLDQTKGVVEGAPAEEVQQLTKEGRVCTGKGTRPDRVCTRRGDETAPVSLLLHRSVVEGALEEKLCRGPLPSNEVAS